MYNLTLFWESPITKYVSRKVPIWVEFTLAPPKGNSPEWMRIYWVWWLSFSFLNSIYLLINIKNRRTIIFLWLLSWGSTICRTSSPYLYDLCCFYSHRKCAIFISDTRLLIFLEDRESCWLCLHIFRFDNFCFARWWHWIFLLFLAVFFYCLAKREKSAFFIWRFHSYIRSLLICHRILFSLVPTSIFSTNFGSRSLDI